MLLIFSFGYDSSGLRSDADLNAVSAVGISAPSTAALLMLTGWHIGHPRAFLFCKCLTYLFLLLPGYSLQGIIGDARS
jgi:hypothetical protein